MQFTPPPIKPPRPLLPSPHTIVGYKGLEGEARVNTLPHPTSTQEMAVRKFPSCSRYTSGYLSCCRVPTPGLARIPANSCWRCTYVRVALRVRARTCFFFLSMFFLLCRVFRVFLLLSAYSLFLFFHLRLLTLSLLSPSHLQVSAAKALQDTSDDFRRRAEPCLLMKKCMHHVKERKRCAATPNSCFLAYFSLTFLLSLLAFSAPTECSHLSDPPFT